MDQDLWQACEGFAMMLAVLALFWLVIRRIGVKQSDSWTEDATSAVEHSVNINGLPMFGGVDTAGNTFGVCATNPLDR